MTFLNCCCVLFFVYLAVNVRCLELTCPSEPKMFREESGIIEFSSSAANLTNVTDLDCYWLIKAPPLQRVRLEVETLDLPAEFNASAKSGSECINDYLSLSSYYKQNEFYRICGIRRNVRFITLYNLVLINFVSKIYANFTVGFKLNYRIMVGTSQSTTTQTPQSTEIVPFMFQYPKCGIPFNKPLEQKLRIVGGKEAIPHSFPWQVLITDGRTICGGSLIESNWVLTAAHCVESSSPLRAKLGMHNRFLVEDTRVDRNISKVYPNPNYLGRINQWDNDIALVRLEKPVEYTNQVLPICLPKQGNNLAFIGTNGIVSGWGYTLGTGSPIVLRQTTVTVNRLSYCGANSENMICAGKIYPEIRDACQGDSGGPFIVKENDTYFLAGVVSWGYDCNGAGIYTKVSNYINWINSVIGKEVLQ